MENDPAVSFQLKTAWHRKKERNVREITDRRIIWEQTKSDILVEGVDEKGVRQLIVTASGLMKPYVTLKWGEPMTSIIN